jgi:hypothetical protein
MPSRRSQFKLLKHRALDLLLGIAASQILLPAPNGGRVRKVRKAKPDHCPAPFLTFPTFLA